MTYRCEFESISEFRLMERRMGGMIRLPAKGGWSADIALQRQAGDEADFEQRGQRWRMTDGGN